MQIRVKTFCQYYIASCAALNLDLHVWKDVKLKITYYAYKEGIIYQLCNLLVYDLFYEDSRICEWSSTVSKTMPESQHFLNFKMYRIRLQANPIKLDYSAAYLAL